jgi:hypothetical protein
MEIVNLPEQHDGERPVLKDYEIVLASMILSEI